MVVATVRAEVHLPEANSLKAKRSVITGLKARLRAKFNISVAEVDHLDLWQRCAIGVALVTNDRRFADEVLSKVVSLIASEPRLELLDYHIDLG
ncbi:MAG: DUF503 domain-containing protein [bacterium]